MSGRSLGVLTLDLIAKTGGFEAGMDKAARVADKRTRDIERQAIERAKAIETAFTGMAKSMMAPLAGAVIGVAGIKSIDSLKSAIEGAISGFAGLKDSAEKTGASIANLSALKGVAKIADFDFTEVESGLIRLSKALHGTDDESKGAGKALAALGLDMQSLRDMDPAQAMLALAKAQAEFADGGGKSAAMMAILGKSGAALIPYLNDLAEQGTLVGKVTTEQALAADEYEKNLKKLQGAWGGLVKQMAVAVVGPAKDITDWMVKAQQEGGALNAVFVGLGMSVAKVFGVEINPLKRSENRVNDLFQELQDKRKIAEAQRGGKSVLGDWMASRTEADIKEIEKQLKGAIAARNKLLQEAADESAPKKTTLNDQSFGAVPKIPKVHTPKAEKEVVDPLTPAAKAYEEVMKSLDKAQTQAAASALNLSATQTELLRVFSDPLFQQMPEPWREMIAIQGEAALKAEQNAADQHAIADQIAADQRRLNELLAATPTAQLEQQRETMQFLAKAFEDGKISAEQFSEAAQTALGTLPDKSEEAKKSFLDLTTVANDAARSMSSTFVDFLFDPMDKSISEMLASFVKAVAKMIAQAAMLQAVKAGMTAMGFSGFAKGGAFEGGVKAFASGGVVTRPTQFKFASGGSFRNGLMGEAGPEAIMPLKRDSNGRLGVSVAGNANGGGGTSNIVNVTVNSGGDSSATGNSDSLKQFGGMIGAKVREIMVSEQRPGGILYR
jgi:hypothetical protein